MSEYSGTLAEQLSRFDSDPYRGITARQAEQSFATFGGNAPGQPYDKSLAARFATQFKNPMTLALAGAAVLAFVLALRGSQGGMAQPVLILVLLCLNSGWAVSRNTKAAKTLEVLQEAYAPKARVVRDGGALTLPGAELVPGDIVMIKAGDFVLADGRLVESEGLVCDESDLAGCRARSPKDHTAQLLEDAPLSERANMVYAGSAVVGGQGRYLVTATGSQTEMNKFVLSSTPSTDDAPIQTKLGRVAGLLGLIGLCATGAVFVAGLARGGEFIPTLLAALALGVVLLPVGPVGTTRYSLALTAHRLHKNGASVRGLSALEALGSVSVICADKTGTLTIGRMSLRKLWPLGGKVENFSADIGGQSFDLLRLAALCCDGRVELRGDELRHIGHPAETAILAGAFEQGMPGADLENHYPRVAELPFDPQRGLKTTVHQVGGKLLCITKGELDALLPRCQNESKNAGRVHEKMCELALSVVAIACRELECLPVNINSETLEQNLIFMGLIGIYDPPREESGQEVSLCRKAGVRTVMASAENPLTAQAIAEELDILRDGEELLRGERLDEVNQEKLRGEIDRYSVYSRLSVQDTVRALSAWQAEGKAVLLTGAEPKDAPALEAADIGCALPHATDIAKSAAGIALDTNHGFETIALAVREGRGTLANINKMLAFLLSCGLAKAVSMLVALTLGWGAPLAPAQLLLLGLVACMFPAVAIGTQPVGRQRAGGRVQRSANSLLTSQASSEGFLFGGLGRAVLLQGMVLGAVTLIGYSLGAHADISRYLPPSGDMGITMAFLVLFVGQLSCALGGHSGDGLLVAGISSVKGMLRALAASLGILAGVVGTPLGGLLGLHPLSMLHWVWAILLSLIPLLVGETIKAAASIKERL